MPEQHGVLNEGFRRMWHYQRVLWFIFFINLLLAHFGAGAATHKVDFLDNSLRSQRLVDTFDVGTFSELASNPEIKLFEVVGVSISYSIVFFVGMLFLAGGILEVYRADRRLTTREFFEACGSYFWRWVRLLMLMAIVTIPVLMLTIPIRMHSTHLMMNAAQEKTGFWSFLIGMAIVGFMLMSIRLWFDMAQVRAVVEEEIGMWRNAGQAFSITFGNFGSLFWMFFRISFLGWLALAVGIWVWTAMPAGRFLWTFFFLELVVLFGFATRLWQRASEMVWYQRRFLIPVVMAPGPVAPAPDPLLAIAPASTPPISQT